MVPLGQLVADNQELCEQLHRFSRAKATQLIAALAVMPQYHANTIRLEVLTHLAVIACAGNVEPNKRDLAKWLRYFDEESWVSRQEDPVEDVFVGVVNSSFGSFRLFSGIFADGYFIVEQLIAFLAKAVSFPTFQETLDIALALLRLSDSLAERCSLKRNTPGSGQSAENLFAPQWRDLKPAFDALVFRRIELERLGLSIQSLEQFIFHEAQLKLLETERLWNSTLERRPLFQIEDGILVAEPSTLARAIARWIVERVMLTQMGGWADTFYQQQNASMFVNDVALALDIKSTGIQGPPSPDNMPLLLPFFGTFDIGKPVVMLTYVAPFAPAVAGFDGYDRFTKEEQNALDEYLVRLMSELERLPNFSGGMILVALAGVGRGHVFQVKTLREKWHVHLAPLHDWLMLAADGKCSALRLWKLAEHVALLKSYNTEFVNPSGLIALWGFWQRSEFWLAPQDLDIHNSRNLLSVGSDFGMDPRLEAKIKHDIHSVRSHDKTTWLSVQRLNPNALFDGDEHSRIYADRLAAREQRLIGCVEGSRITWWVMAPEVNTSGIHRDLLFQLWECVLQWTDRASDIIERELVIGGTSVEILLDLPDLARWKMQQKPAGDAIANPHVDVRPASFSMTITLHERFLGEFNQPKNIAEKAIVNAIVTGAERLSGIPLTDEARSAVVSTIVPNDDARFFHVVESHMVEHMVGASLRGHPIFIADEDLTVAQIGLADLAGRPQSGLVLTGKKACQEFLEKTVEKLWERVEKRLQPFDRRSVVRICFSAIAEINKDAEHWKLTTRSVLALHTEEKTTKGVLAHRRSQRSIASLANRILIETAQYSTRSKDGKRFNRVDHSRLLADVDLLITMAHHHDAIAYDVLRPELSIHPRGDVEVDTAFYEAVMQKYMSHRSEKLTDRAAKGYESYFDPEAEPASVLSDEEIKAFDVAFEAEVGFSARQFVQISELWRGFAIDSKELSGVVEEPQMLDLLSVHANMAPDQTERFLSRFSLPIRTAWDADLPPRCAKQDVFPWRFRRNLSLLMRPLVLVSTEPRGWLISAPLFEKAAAYLTGNIYEGRLPDRFFASGKMRSYIGEMVRKHGHAFGDRVAEVFTANGYRARTEVKMTELGAPGNPDLGDIDILAWSATTGIVYLVESKRLTSALTVREVIQRLEDFRGDEKRKDSLGKHVRRINWLARNLSGLAGVVQMAITDIKLRPLLVTSESVPMQFFKEMNFPTEQVVPIDELGLRLPRQKPS